MTDKAYTYTRLIDWRNEMEIQGVLEFVASASADDCDTIRAAVRSRESVLSQTGVAQMALRAGDEVVLGGDIHPTYLRGAVAKVARVNTKTVAVDIPVDPRYRRYSGSRGVRCPNSFIERKVEGGVSSLDDKHEVSPDADTLGDFVAFKDEDTLGGQVVGPIFIGTDANGVGGERYDDKWHTRQEARAVARDLGAELIEV